MGDIYCTAECWRLYFRRLYRAGLNQEELSTAMTQALSRHPFEDGNIWAGYMAALTVPALNGLSRRLEAIEEQL